MRYLLNCPICRGHIAGTVPFIADRDVEALMTGVYGGHRVRDNDGRYAEDRIDSDNTNENGAGSTTGAAASGPPTVPRPVDDVFELARPALDVFCNANVNMSAATHIQPRPPQQQLQTSAGGPIRVGYRRPRSNARIAVHDGGLSAASRRLARDYARRTALENAYLYTHAGDTGMTPRCRRPHHSPAVHPAAHTLQP